jgi:hypothetical protein
VATKGLRSKWAELTFETKVTKVIVPILVPVLIAASGTAGFLIRKWTSAPISRPPYIVAPHLPARHLRQERPHIADQAFQSGESFDDYIGGYWALTFANPTEPEPMRLIKEIEAGNEVGIRCWLPGTASLRYGQIVGSDFDGRWILMRDLVAKDPTQHALKRC